MRRHWWKTIFFSLLSICIIGNLVNVPAVKASSPAERVHVPLRDIAQAAWAEQEIREMTLRGVVSGYADGTFRPNQVVSKLEALVMAVRVLGLEKEAGKLAEQSDPQFHIFQGKGLDWAKGYLRAAYNQGLIQNYMQEHNWHEPADRAWMAQLMVRLLGKEQEALELPDYSLGFTDERDIIPRSRSKYIAVAMHNGLLSGYPDRTFRPQRAMTRAELAVLLTNYHERYVEDYSLRKEEYATIEEVDLERQEIILRTQDRNANLKKYSLHKDAPVFFKESKQLTRKPLSFLERNQTITFMEHQNQLLMVEVIYEGYPGADYTYNDEYKYGTEYMVGFIVSVAANGQSLTIEDFQGKRNTYQLAGNVEIIRHGQQITGQALRVGDMYTYQLTDNRVNRLEFQPSERTTFTGEVTALLDYLSELHIYHEIEGSYDYYNNMRTFYLPKGYKPTVRERDYVRVYTYGQFVYDVELLSTTYIEGYFRKYDEDKHELTIIDTYGKSHTYALAPTREMQTSTNKEQHRLSPYLRINVPGERSDSLEALHYNDYVQLTFDTYDQTNNRNKMEVLSIQVLNQLQGTIESASYSTLTVRNPDGYSLRYSFADYPQIRVVGITGDAKRSDLRIHDQITYRVRRGEVIEVNVYQRSEHEGTILNLQDNQLILLDRSGQRLTYKLNSSTRITWHDFRNLSRSELKTGQRVKFWFDGDLLTEVQLLNEGMVTGLLIDYSRDSVWLRVAEDEQSRYILGDRPRISSPTGRNTRLEDLENRIVTLSFAESKVVSIMEELQTEQEYVVMAIDSQQRSIRLQDEQRKQYIYKLPERVYYAGKEYTPQQLAEAISFKQRVRLHMANHHVLALD